MASRGGKAGRRPPLEVTTQLLQWGARGTSQARVNDHTVVVDRGIPGETVDLLVERGRKPWRASVDNVLQSHPQRIDPPCPYFLAGCGGCQWQHLSYQFQLDTKHAMVTAELASAGLPHGIDAVHGMDEPWRYRHTAAIALGWEAGFRPRGRRGIIEIRDCRISHPAIGRLAAAMNDVLRAGLVPNYHGKVWLDCTVLGADDDANLQVLVQGIPGLTMETHPELPAVAEQIAGLPTVASVAYRHRDGSARPLVGPLVGSIEIDGQPLLVPAGAFFQTNHRMLERLLRRMRDIIAGRVIRAAADVYGGVGTFGLPLAASVEHMTLIELDVQAVEAARQAAHLAGITNMSFLDRHAEKALPVMADLDLVIVDPPRSGLGETVTAALAEVRPPLLLYVSCAPASLARDLRALLDAGFTLASLELYDFYPQTYHVESLAVLTR